MQKELLNGITDEPHWTKKLKKHSVTGRVVKKSLVHWLPLIFPPLDASELAGEPGFKDFVHDNQHHTTPTAGGSDVSLRAGHASTFYHVFNL